jgi:hypothetical protein
MHKFSSSQVGMPCNFVYAVITAGAFLGRGGIASQGFAFALRPATRVD